MPLTVKIFVAEDCSGCVEARSIAAHIEQHHSRLNVEVIDINRNTGHVPETVFATPTYMLNNQVVSLGNPTLDEVARWAGQVNEVTDTNER